MEKLCSLGEGSYGSVDLVRYREDDGLFKLYALKSSKAWAYSNLAKELKVLSDLQGCSGVVQCKNESIMETTDFKGDRMYSVLLEYANGGTIKTLMKTHEDKILPDHKIRKFAKMILRGLQSIHAKGYVHCDLKPENILVFNRVVEKDGVQQSIDEVKIADFGLTVESKKMQEEWWSPSSPFIGTPLYMSPESVKSGKIGSCLDIWSFGCIILQMYTGKKPWPGKTLEEIKVALMNGMTPEIPEHLPILAKRFLDICFVLNPRERSTASKLLNQPFFREFFDDPNIQNGRKEGPAPVEYTKRNVKIKFKTAKKPSPAKNKVTVKFVCNQPKQEFPVVKFICRRPKQESPAKNKGGKFICKRPKNNAAKFRNIPPQPKIRKVRIIPPKQLVQV